MEGKFNQKCSRVIRNLRKRALALHKEFILDIAKTRCTRKRKNDRWSEHSIYLQEEKWKKKLKLPTSNFEGTELKKNLKKFKRQGS